MNIKTAISTAMVAGLMLASASTAALARSFDDIISSGKIRIGMVVDSPPFGILDESNEPDGYDADVAKLIASYLELELEIVPVTSANRIPYLLTDKVDAMVAVLGITPARAKQVLFSMPYSAIDIVLAGPKSLELTSYDDLVGKTISVPRAAAPDLALARFAPEGAEIQRYDDDSTSIQAVLSGQAELIGTNNLIAGNIMTQNPDLDLEVKLTMTHQYQGIAVPRGSEELQQWLNTFIYYVKNSGELNSINQKWLNQPLSNLPSF